MVNLTLSYAKKDQTDPSKYRSLHNEVKDVFQDYDFIYTYGSVSDDKAAAAAVINDYFSIKRLPDKSSIFSAELHALYLSSLLRVVSNTDLDGGLTVLLRLYRALVHSKLDYGCFIYGAACKSYIFLLDPIQNHG